MSFSSRPGRSAGAITFAFEDLTIARERGERQVFGRATIAFDRAGGYWPTAITLDSSTFGGAPKVLSDGSPTWREVTRLLEQYRGDAIAERIITALENEGLHMALFGEHLPPPPVRRSPPPYVSPAARQAQLMLARASLCADCATIACRRRAPALQHARRTSARSIGAKGHAVCGPECGKGALIGLDRLHRRRPVASATPQPN